MNLRTYEFQTQEFVDPTPLTLASLENLGFPTSQKDLSIQLSTGKLAVVAGSNSSGVVCQFEDQDGDVIDVLPHHQTVGDLKFLIWRLDRPQPRGARVDEWLVTVGNPG